MKRKLLLSLAVALPLALFLAAREAASWRPQLIGKTTASHKVQISPNGLWACLMDGEGSEIWDLQTWQRVRGKFYGFQDFSPDSRHFAVVISNSRGAGALLHTPQVQLFDVASGKLVRSWRDERHFPDDWLAKGRFSPDGKRFIVVTQKTCRQFEVASGKLLSRAELGTDEEPLRQAAISPDGRHFLESGAGVKLRRVEGGDVVLGRLDARGPMGWSPDGQFYWDRDAKFNNLRLWRLRDHTLVQKVTYDTWLHFTPDSKHLAVATPKGLELRDVLTGKIVQTLPGPQDDPFAFAPDGSFAVAVDGGGKIWKWRLK
ncbi:MAG: hypothetical protein KY445_13150 [Armatimonadetes bacterium]|nr:hypothetical protein [Armatimonadota bacterium]